MHRLWSFMDSAMSMMYLGERKVPLTRTVERLFSSKTKSNSSLLGNFFILRLGFSIIASWPLSFFILMS